MGRLIFIIGGARSGKSTFAQQLAQKTSKNVVYIATAESLDEEMEKRIRNHQKIRPTEWATIEAPLNIREKYIKANEAYEVVIIDCLTLLVSNILMVTSENEQPGETKAYEKLLKEFSEIMQTIHESDALWIIVSNEVGLGIVPGDLSSRIYRDLLGKLNQWMAAQAEEVYFMVAGIPVPIQQHRI